MLSAAQFSQRAQQIRLIVADMDGTLLDSKKRLSAATCAAAAAARAAGVHFTFCTGRVWSMLGYFVRELNLSGPVITANGAQIFDAGSGAVVYERLPEPGAALRLLAYCQSLGADVVTLSEQQSLFARDSERIEKFRVYNESARAAGLAQMRLEYYGDADAGARKITKFLVQRRRGEPRTIHEKVEAYLKTKTEFDFFFSDPDCMEIVAAGVNKGDGARAAARILGLEDSAVCAFGDFYNDLPMFAAAGLAVAMDNAPNDVKQRADFVCASNDADGVALGVAKILQCINKEQI